MPGFMVPASALPIVEGYKLWIINNLGLHFSPSVL
jgi:hypothetical protein